MPAQNTRRNPIRVDAVAVAEACAGTGNRAAARLLGGMTQVHPMDIPIEGYPISADAVTTWFRERYGRAPLEREVGAILLAMSERDTTPLLERCLLDDPADKNTTEG